MEGGVQSEGRKKGEGRAGHFQLLRESLISVFIDNIPGDRDASWLRKLFDYVGKTMDVFIPYKERRVTNSRFGFVRYKEMEEAQAAIRRWNGAMFGRCRLAVKLADYGGKPWNSVNDSGVGQMGRSTEGLRRPNLTKVVGVVDPKEASIQSIAKKRKVSLEVIPENEEWMLRSAVAELKAFIPLSQIEDDLKLNGVKFHKIFPYGGNKVLIHFDSLADLELCPSGTSAAFCKWFSSIQKWKEEEPSKLRSVWLSIIEIPFKAWSEANFQKVVEPFGFLLKMELKDFQESGLERARVLVETRRLDRIFEVIEAVVGGKVLEVVICEECFFNGREMEWKVVETPDEGEEVDHCCSFNEGQSCKSRHQRVVEKAGDRVLEVMQGSERDLLSDEGSSRCVPGDAKSVHSGLVNQGSTDSILVVPETPRGRKVSCESSLGRSAGKEKERGKSLPIRDEAEGSWNTTLFSYLQQKRRGSVGKEMNVQTGLGSCLPWQGEERKGNEKALGESEDPILRTQDEVAVEDSISQEEAFSRRLVSIVGEAKRGGNQKLRLAKDFEARSQNSFKVVKRKESKEKAIVKRKDSKEKEVFKLQRMKKRAELTRLKKSYLLELEVSNKSIQSADKESLLEVEKEAEEEERRRLVRKEAERTYHIATRLGIKGNLPEEEMIQFYGNLLN